MSKYQNQFKIHRIVTITVIGSMVTIQKVRVSGWWIFNKKMIIEETIVTATSKNPFTGAEWCDEAGKRIDVLLECELNSFIYDNYRKKEVSQFFV